MIPVKMWDRSRGLAFGAIVVLLAMVATVIGYAVNTHGTFATFAPEFFWGLGGVLVGMWIATDLLTRRERAAGGQNH